MLGTARDVTINYNVPDTATRHAIESLKKKAEDTDTVIKLTRKEILLLSRALQDLDQRTSGLQKLPDGRTLFGHLISGNPTIVIQEHEAARTRFAAGDYKAALEYSQRAIKSYEDTKQVPATISTGDLTPETVGKLYQLGAVIAQRLQKNELANEYAAKADEVHPSPERQAILATTLFNIGKIDEAIATISKAVEAEPSNEEYRRLKDEMSKRAAVSRHAGS
jgi:tetratricopeptide (TPR) repeat protein